MEMIKKFLYIFVTVTFLFPVLLYKYPHLLHTNVIILKLSDWKKAEISSEWKYLWRPDSDGLLKNDRILDQLEWMKTYSKSLDFKFKTTNKKRILVFDSDHSYYQTDNKLNCPSFDFNYCDLIFSNRIEKPAESLGDYDAVVFAQDGGRQTELSVPDTTKQIIYILESPNVARASLSMNNAILASYHRGSDITISYGKWTPFMNTTNTLSTNSSVGINFAEGKTALAVIFMSNCNGKNNRNGYIHDLQKYINVDIYGRCGRNMECLDGLNRYKCMENVIRKYKFYLAFENSNCRDYITEKFYRNGFQYGAVPIVLGAHPDDYKVSAPPHSFISVEDFESPQMLAEYLKFLDGNDTLYNKYFRWRGTGELYFSWKYFFCHVCGMLFYADYIPPPKWKPNSSWSSVSKCLPDNQWKWVPKKKTLVVGSARTGTDPDR